MAAARPIAILKKINPASPLHYPASKTALLLLDYQNITVDFLPEQDRFTAITTAAGLRQWASENSIAAFHCLVDMNRPPKATSKMSERWNVYEKMLASNPAGAHEHPVLQPINGDSEMEVTVTRQVGIISALKSDGLLESLEKKGITSLVMAGLSTSGCLLSTARAAADEGFVTTVVEEGCWDMGEGVHEMLCQKVLPSSVNVVGLENWLEQWGKE